MGCDLDIARIRWAELEAKEKPAEGTVVAVGKGKLDRDGKVIPMELKTGDRVLFSKYGGTEVKLDGKEYLIMSQDDVLCVVDA